MITVERSPKYTFGKNLSHWKRATFAAESIYQPRYDLLQDLYTDISIDSHLSACIQNRKANVLQCEFVLQDARGNLQPVPKWLYDVLEWLSETPLYGYTVLEYHNGVFNLIPRRHIVPPVQEILLDLQGKKRLKISDEPTLLTFGDPFDLGVLHKACPVVFYKRFATASWSEYIELFGIPVRVLKTDKKDQKERMKLFNELQEMGKAAFAIVDSQDDLEFVNGSSTDAYSVFDKMIERCNSEIAKLILGQTGTTDEKSYAGSAKVHQTQAEAIAWQDKEKVKYWLNSVVFPYLKLPYTFEWVQADALSISEQWTIHKEMLQLGLPVDIEFLSKKYNTPFVQKPKDNTKKNDKPKKIYKAPDLGYPPVKTGFLKKTFKNLRKAVFKNDLDDVIYNSIYNSRNLESTKVPETKVQKNSEKTKNVLKKIIRSLRRLLFRNYLHNIEELLKLPEREATEKLFEHYKNTFLKAIDKGFKNPDFGSTEGFRYVQIQENAYKFAYAKSKYVWQTITQAADDRKAGLYKNLHENYTEAEAEHFTASGRMAKKWFDIQKTKEEFPYLQYITAHDDRVRPTHKVLDGIIRPVDDPFWQTYYPPNGYRCRCTVKKLADIPEGYQERQPQPESEGSVFENNPGVTGIVFNESHTYFKENFTDANKSEIQTKIRNDIKKSGIELFDEGKKGFDFDFPLFFHKLHGYNSDVKKYVSDPLGYDKSLYGVKNLLLLHLDKILNGKNITEVWETIPDQDETHNTTKVYYVNVKLLPEWYFVLKLRKTPKVVITFYNLTKWSDKIQGRNPEMIFKKE